MRRGCLCVFAKPPRPGTAKTRLASVLGEDSAAALARAFLLDTWSTATRVPGMDVVLAATEVEAPEWHPLHAAEVWPQGTGTLGDRLERVLRRALQTYPFAITVGPDIPGLPLSRLDDAREALGTADAVIGPADDGGFYLIGVSACPHGLLDTVPWSAPDTCAHTLERLGQHHLTRRSLRRISARDTHAFPHGDQALLVRRDAFQRVGGFPAQPLFEDVEISRRLRSIGHVQTLRAQVSVTGRRFLSRPLYFAILMNVLPILYRLGVSPQTLQRAYGDVR